MNKLVAKELGGPIAVSSCCFFAAIKRCEFGVEFA